MWLLTIFIAVNVEALHQKGLWWRKYFWPIWMISGCGVDVRCVTVRLAVFLNMVRIRIFMIKSVYSGIQSKNKQLRNRRPTSRISASWSTSPRRRPISWNRPSRASMKTTSWNRTWRKSFTRCTTTRFWRRPSSTARTAGTCGNWCRPWRSAGGHRDHRLTGIPAVYRQPAWKDEGCFSLMSSTEMRLNYRVVILFQGKMVCWYSGITVS